MAQKFVFVTGAAKGIGRAISLHLSKQGFTVIAGVRNAADGEELQHQAASRLEYVLIDVTNQAQVEQAAAQIGKIVGDTGLAALVNNAGIAVAAPLEFVPIEEFRYQLEVNLIGQIAVIQTLVPYLRKTQGRIINITSIGGRVAGPMLGAYHASKYGMEAVTDTLRAELKSWGIEVVAIEPGAVATPIWETASAAADKIIEQMPQQVNEFYGEAIAKTRKSAAINSKKGIDPEQVAIVVEKALNATRPKTRYLVGPDAKIAGLFVSKLPDRLRDRVLKTI